MKEKTSTSLADYVKIELEVIKENEDGSADILLKNLDSKAIQYLLNYAFVNMLKSAISEGKLYTPKE
ncbi:MAG: hypothetical protein EBU08_08060 [Micrococcales bacterium]|nr:hypothetical protein [Micrococcales bacterium]NBT47705.1 hypothetical protein [Actinomycetota bacterium]